jgi:hypothetical protein
MMFTGLISPAQLEHSQNKEEFKKRNFPNIDEDVAELLIQVLGTEFNRSKFEAEQTSNLTSNVDLPGSF